MNNQEIQQKEWRSFLDDFSRRHLGQPVTVEILAGNEGPQILAADLPLMGVVSDPKGSDGRVIAIITGESPDANMVHEIRRPSHLRIARTDDGQETALEFESDDEPKAILHFGTPETAAHLVG